MKKILFFAAVATMFAACTKDATKDLAPAKPTDTFYVSIGDDDSRVQLNEQVQTVWTAGDCVSVFNKTTGNCCYEFTGKTGDRTGGLSYSYMPGNATGDAISQVVAIYPFDFSNSIASNGTVSTVMPFVQTYCKDSFGIGSSIMVARSNNENLSFCNVMGWIRVALTGENEKTISRITLQGNNNELIAGNATIDNDMSITPTADAIRVVILNCGDGVKISNEKPTYFYIAVPPQTFEKGISICVFDTDNKFMKFSTDNNITVIRNHIIPMKSLEYDGKDGIPTNQIWYTSSRYGFEPESYNGNIVSHIFESGIGVITFDSEQTEIGDNAFNYRSGLTSITIPDSVTTIDKQAFYRCTGLTSITIPDSVTTIGDSAFNGCTGLTSITIPDSVTTIGNAAFGNNYRLTSVTIPDSVTTIGDIPFLNCWGLKSIYGKYASEDNRCLIVEGNLKAFARAGLTEYTIPDGVKTIERYMFLGCRLLTSITMPNCVTTIHKRAFEGCDGLTNINIPDSVTTIDNEVFQLCKELNSVTIGSNVETIGAKVFYNCKNLQTVYCKAIIPPTLDENAFKVRDSSTGGDNNIDCTIYVPRALVDTYKSADGWKEYASRIEGHDFE